MRRRIWLIVGLIAVAPAPAKALCIYRGVDNARTSLEQEFRDSRWVVRARVVSAQSHWPSDDDESESEPWTLYRLEVVQSYKGVLPRRFTFFTGRHSGGFYMDRDGGAPDVGGEYLLFLVRYPRSRTDPPAARRALWVNYSCGQSRPWREVTGDERRRLLGLARGR